MRAQHFLGLFVAIVIALVFVVTKPSRPNLPAAPVSNNVIPLESTDPASIKEQAASVSRRVDFSSLNPVYQFSANLPSALQFEYSAQLQAINIYDSQSNVGSPLERSQVFIRFFEANRFLTLSTVNVLTRETTSMGGHAAVRYEIEKKSGLPLFVGQPRWRSGRHDLIDIRLRDASPSYFYVIARNPEFSKERFEEFIGSIQFY